MSLNQWELVDFETGLVGLTGVRFSSPQQEESTKIWSPSISDSVKFPGSTQTIIRFPLSVSPG